MKNKFINVLKEKIINFPLYLYRYRIQLDLTDGEIIFLAYLMNLSDLSLDVEKFSDELSLDSSEIFNILDELKNKNIINIETKTIEKGLTIETIILSNLYQKLMDILLNDENSNDNSVVFNKIENAFGRTLNSIETEYISAWLNTYNDELILAAVKEAVLNGVNNLKYIDKILIEWEKKGITKVENLESKNIIKPKESVTEIFDYEWYNE